MNDEQKALAIIEQYCERIDAAIQVAKKAHTQ